MSPSRRPEYTDTCRASSDSITQRSRSPSLIPERFQSPTGSLYFILFYYYIISMWFWADSRSAYRASAIPAVRMAGLHASSHGPRPRAYAYFDRRLVHFSQHALGLVPALTFRSAPRPAFALTLALGLGLVLALSLLCACQSCASMPWHVIW